MSDEIQVGDRFEWLGKDGELWRHGKAYAARSRRSVAWSWNVDTEKGVTSGAYLNDDGTLWKRLPRAVAMPEVKTCPRRAMSLDDLRVGMRIQYYFRGQKPANPNEMTVTAIGPGVFDCDDMGRRLDLCEAFEVMIVRDPPEAKPVEALKRCGLCDRELPAHSAVCVAGKVAAAEGRTWSNMLTKCDPRCTRGAPCRRSYCRNAALADGGELNHRALDTMAAAQEAEKAAIIANWKREQEAPPPVIRPWGALDAAMARPFVRVVRRGR